MKYNIGRLNLIKGDITKLSYDAIVNAANSSLLGGGGVDGAIHRAGGSAILEECRAIRARQGKCKTGQAVITTAGNMPAQKVIHTVGPVWNNGGDKVNQLLADCYRNSLQLAVDNGLKTIVFPNISTGIYRFPKAEAAVIALTTVNDFLAQNESIKEVIFCCFDEENYQLYLNELTTVTADSISNVLIFKDFIQKATESEFYTINTEQSSFDPYVYSQKSKDFFNALQLSGFVQAYDWGAWAEQAKAFYSTPELLKSASIIDIIRLCTFHIRQDRFNAGHLAKILKNKYFSFILDRLSVI